MNRFDFTHSRDPWPGALMWFDLQFIGGSTVTDQSDYANNGTLVGSPTVIPKDMGEAGYRFSTGNQIQLDGSTQCIQFPSTLLASMPPSGWTIVVRFSTTNGSNQFGSIFGIVCDSGQNNFIVALGGFGNQFGVALHAGGTLNSEIVTLTQNFLAGQIYQIALVWKAGPTAATGTYQVWINDTLEGELTGKNLTQSSNNEPFTIGALTNTGGGLYAPFAGNIGFACIMPRALSAAEIGALYRREASVPASPIQDRLIPLGESIAPTSGDDGSLEEPALWWNPTRQLWQCYAHGGTTTSGIRLFESSTGAAGSWTDPNGAFVLGGGAGGEPSNNIGRCSLVDNYPGLYLYLFYDDTIGANSGSSTHGVWVATSLKTDGRVWVKQGSANPAITQTSPIIPNSSLTAATELSTQGYVLGPAVCWDGTNWCMIAQVFAIVNGYNQWQSLLWTGPNLGAMTLNPYGYLCDLQVGSGMFGGYCLTVLSDGRYLLSYHVSLSNGNGNVPTHGRLATSYNLTRWQQLPNPDVQLNFIVSGQNQVADLCLAYNGAKTLVIANCCNDSPPPAVLGGWEFDGTIEELIADRYASTAGHPDILPLTDVPGGLTDQGYTIQAGLAELANQTAILALIGNANQQANVEGGLQAQGYTLARAGYLDVLIGLVPAIATAVWSAATRTLTAFGFAPTLAASQDFNNAGQTTPTPSSNGSLAGSGVTLTFHDGNGNPVPGVSFSIAGYNATGTANSSGVATFGLANGSYTVVALPTNGIIFSNYALTVSGATAATITGSAPAAIPSPSTGQTVCYVYTKDATGTLQSGVMVCFEVTASPLGESGNSYSTTTKTVASNGSALAAVAMPVGASVVASVGGGTGIPFTVPATNLFPDGYPVGDLLGNY